MAKIQILFRKDAGLTKNPLFSPPKTAFWCFLARFLGRVLAHGRTKINAIVRSVYLKAALGRKKLKDKSVTTRHLRDSNGMLTDEEDVQTTV